MTGDSWRIMDEAAEQALRLAGKPDDVPMIISKDPEMFRCYYSAEWGDPEPVTPEPIGNFEEVIDVRSLSNS